MPNPLAALLAKFCIETERVKPEPFPAHECIPVAGTNESENAPPTEVDKHQFASVRQGLIEELFDQVNVTYRGGTLNWPRLNALENDLRAAENRHDFHAIAQVYRHCVAGADFQEATTASVDWPDYVWKAIAKIGTPQPQTEWLTRWDRAPAAWSGDDAKLIGWFQSHRDQLPREPFDLKRGTRVSAPSKFFATLERDIKAGSNGPRAVGLLHELRRLRELFGIRKKPTLILYPIR